jgi:hypothetical protein
MIQSLIEPNNTDIKDYTAHEQNLTGNFRNSYLDV